MLNRIYNKKLKLRLIAPKRYVGEKNNFLQAMSTETILGRLYDKLNASRCMKDFMSIMENLAEGGIPVDNICVQSFLMLSRLF